MTIEQRRARFERLRMTHEWAELGRAGKWLMPFLDGPPTEDFQAAMDRFNRAHEAFRRRAEKEPAA